MLNTYELEMMDLNLRLFAGMDLHVDNICIKPKTVNEIIRDGYSIYSEHLGILTAREEDIFKDMKIDSKLSMFDHIIMSGNDMMVDKLFNSICYFLGEDNFSFDPSLGLVFGDLSEDEVEDIRVVNGFNFNEIADIIRYQNCVKYPDSKQKYNPKNEKARKIIEKLNKGKEAVEKAKKKDNDNVNIDFLSIVSSVSAKSNTISKFNVGQLTVYQLYDEFKRLEMISGYETSILAIFNGVEVKDLKHWSSKIDV